MRKVELRQIVQFLALVFVATASAAWSAGCKSSPEVEPSTGVRAPTTPDQVKIYQKAPRKYEVLGVIVQEVTPDIRWDERGDATKGFEVMKAKAAAHGATGLLLVQPDPTQKHSALAAYKGEYYTVPIRFTEPRAAVAQAIYVLEEK